MTKMINRSTKIKKERLHLWLIFFNMHLSGKLHKPFGFSGRCVEHLSVVAVHTSRTRDRRFLELDLINPVSVMDSAAAAASSQRARDVRVMHSFLSFHQHG